MMMEQNNNDQVQSVQEPPKNNNEQGSLALISSNAAGVVDLTSHSTQGGADDTVQDTAVPEHSVHLPNASENDAVNKKRLSNADHLKELQSMALGDGSLEKG